MGLVTLAHLSFTFSNVGAGYSFFKPLIFCSALKMHLKPTLCCYKCWKVIKLKSVNGKTLNKPCFLKKAVEQDGNMELWLTRLELVCEKCRIPSTVWNTLLFACSFLSIFLQLKISCKLNQNTDMKRLGVYYLDVVIALLHRKSESRGLSLKPENLSGR